MKGFFTKEQTKSKSRPDGKVYSCASCGLYQSINSPRMQASGNFKKGILNVGEMPTEADDTKGTQFQGREGRDLKRVYKKQGIDLFEDCLNINAVNCRPVNEKGGNRKPTDYEISCCRQRILKIIDQYQPKVIVLFGACAVKSLLGYRWKKDLGGITKWRGWTIPDRDFKAWICPVQSIREIQSQEDNEVLEIIWEQDIERALKIIKEPFPDFPKEEKQVQIIQDKYQITNILNDLNEGSFPPDPQLLAFDIESSGLKPYAKEHSISCISFCNNPNSAYVIPMPKRKTQKKALKDLLENPDLGKVAANMKFEDTWMKIKAGIGVKNWAWDTMQAAHILDNRPGISGLKFQTYVNFGVIDYDEEIAPYLKGVDEKNGNSLNRIHELTENPDKFKKLMLYCGMDSLFTYKLALKQMQEFNFNPEEF